jgi:aryl-alcohol dehydrogenase-like predicted oxidoreductase
MVSALGFGGGSIGRDDVEDAQASRILHRAFELGVTLFDTARSYGSSEERIGRHLADRRDRVVLSTKIGYGIEGIPDWTGPCITAGVEAALGRMGTDYIDIVHLHSCPTDVLERGEVIEALVAASQSGKIRIAAYSGDNDPLRWAVHDGRFGGVQTSVSLCDRWSLRRAIPAAAERGLGVIAKRPIANAFWRFDDRPQGDDCEPYWERWHGMAHELGDLDPSQTALRFTAFAPGVSSCIVGTTRVQNLERNAELVALGPLPRSTLTQLAHVFDHHGRDWPGQI